MTSSALRPSRCNSASTAAASAACASPDMLSRVLLSSESSSWKWRCASVLMEPVLCPAAWLRGLCCGSTEPAGDVCLGALVLRTGEDLLCLPELDELAEVEEPRVIRHAGRLLHVMRNDHDRVGLFQLDDQFFDAL